MRTPAHQPTVGVIGGMGPEATIDLMRRVLAATPAQDDADHIRMIVDNNAKVPSRIKALIEGTGEDPTPVLQGMARGLETAGADFLVIPCNTAHYYLGAIREAVQVPVADMIGLSVARIRRDLGDAPRIGMLASPAVRLTGLFEQRCREAGVDVLWPAGDDDAHVLAIIKAVKAGTVTEANRQAYRAAVRHLVANGAGLLVIACTELSVLGGCDGLGAPVMDTLDVLVDDILERCGVRRKVTTATAAE
ncbi:MAG: aspartate/glutamate racemase family protein [Hyphomicrobiaceae bacterium]